MSVTIRKADITDAPEVAELFIASQAEALPFLSKLHTPAETRIFITEDVFANCEVWVALEEGRIVGMMALAGNHIDHLYLRPDTASSMVCKVVKNILAKEPYPKTILMDLNKSEHNVHLFT